MSLADRLGARLSLNIEVSFAGKSTMRTIINQLVEARLTYDHKWVDSYGYSHCTRRYRGKFEMLPEDLDPSALRLEQKYIYLQRSQERVDAMRHLYSLGIYESDCPY